MTITSPSSPLSANHNKLNDARKHVKNFPEVSLQRIQFKANLREVEVTYFTVLSPARIFPLLHYLYNPLQYYLVLAI